MPSDPFNDAAPIPGYAVIDHDILNETRELMEDKFPLLLTYYLEDGPGYLQQIEKGIAEGNTAATAAAAHTLKSSSRQFGILKVGDLAACLEERARTLLQQGGESCKELGPLAVQAIHAFAEAERVLKPYLV